MSIYLLESEEENERSISPYKKEGNSNKHETGKKSLNQVHVKKKKSKKKLKFFTQSLESAQKAMKEEKNPSLKGKRKA